MVKVYFDEVLEQENPVIQDKFLVVSTVHDGYTNTHLGQYNFKVLLEGEVGKEEYKVFPIYMKDDGVFVNEKYPVIQTDGDLVLFSMNTTIDPYGASHIEELEVLEGQSKEKAVLYAFEAYVRDAFALAKYHLMIADGDLSVLDEGIEFERTHKFERDVIHPRAGQRG